MHGIVMVQFEAFVQKNFGAEAWRALCAETRLGDRIYLPVSVYPDAEIFALMEAAVEMTSKPAPELLGLFGEHLIPPLLETYGNPRMKSWGALDLLENTETTIHRVVRAREPDATPPQLYCERVSENEVEIAYRSARGLCALALGLVRGVATYYNEELEVHEKTCMHRGAEACLIRARKFV